MERQPFSKPERSHEARYKFASTYIIPGDTVLDVFCGSGYGTHILSKMRPKRIVGFDRQDQFPNLKGVEFISAQYPQIDFPMESFSFVTFFEGIEHIDQDLGIDLLSDIYDWMTPGGQLFISSPNSFCDPYSPKRYPEHVLHYDPFEFEEMLKFIGFRVDEWWNHQKGQVNFSQGNNGKIMVARCLKD